MSMVVIVTPAHCLSQVLHIGHLAALRGLREVGRHLVELARRRRIAVSLRCLGSALQIRSDLLGHLLILRRIRLLNLL